MPKLPSLTPQKIIKILEMKGFILKRVTGGHHVYSHPETKRRVVVPVHSGRDIAKGTLLEILKEAGLTREELIDLV